MNNMMLKEIVSANISYLRKKYNMTQAELGEIACVHHSAIGHYEAGRHLPRTATAVKICRFFDLGPDWLFQPHDDRTWEKVTTPEFTPPKNDFMLKAKVEEAVRANKEEQVEEERTEEMTWQQILEKLFLEVADNLEDEDIFAAYGKKVYKLVRQR